MSTVLLACQPVDCTNGVQDGNETGVDCGGGCNNSCMNLDSLVANNPVLKEIQGKWYSNAVISFDKKSDGLSSVLNSSIAFSTCPLEFTKSNMYFTSNYFNADLLGDLQKSGSSNNCSYPQVSRYQLNIEDNTLSINGSNLFSMNPATQTMYFKNEATNSTKEQLFVLNKMELSLTSLNKIAWEIKVLDNELLDNDIQLIFMENTEQRMLVELQPERKEYSGVVQNFSDHVTSKISFAIRKSKHSKNDPFGQVKLEVRLVADGITLAEYKGTLLSYNLTSDLLELTSIEW